MKYVKTITIDISKKIYETIETKSKDTSRYLLFKILDNGVPLDLTSKTVRAYSSANKFNDLVVVSAKDGLCELKLTTEFLGAPGLTHVELTIYEGIDTLSSMIFCINNMACLRNDAAIEATNEFSALTVALNKVEVLDKNLNMASTDLEKKYTERLNGIDAQLEDKVDKVADKQLSTNDFTTAHLNKLNGIETGANAYVHPSTHLATMISQDATHRFATDAEKANWNNAYKEPTKFPITFSPNIINESDTMYSFYLKKNGFVVLQTLAKSKDGNPFPYGWVPLLTLPVGFRPSATVYFNLCTMGGVNVVPAYVSADGNVMFFHYQDSDNVLKFGFTFHAGGGTV